ncbi:MAG: polysaccharide deacetylase [Ilumatobacteraceae bacterium]|nr:polysaccharide deacetylase [Ilumatobacteraceae bacterium]
MSRSSTVRTRPEHRTGPARFAGIAVAVAVAALAASCSNEPAPPAPPPPAISIGVVHDGSTTTVRIRSGRTIGDALDKAGVDAADGQELAAASKEPLGPNGNEPTYLIDSEPVSRAEVLEAPATIEVLDGEDTVEPTEVVRRQQTITGLPNALEYVQFAGQPGMEEATVGTKSGETVSAVPLDGATPAHRATGKVLALTFDDGPHPTYTPEVLDVLEAKEVPATFCTIGTMVEEHPDLAQRIVDEGHQLCNHTLDHVEGLEDEPRTTVVAQMDGGRDAIVDAVGEPPAFYRPPGGSLGPVIYEEAAAHDEAVLYWSIDPQDWQKPTADELVLDVISRLKPGGIILLHDGGGNREATVAALPRIIDEARKQGYTFTAPISGRPQVG